MTNGSFFSQRSPALTWKSLTVGIAFALFSHCHSTLVAAPPHDLSQLGDTYTTHIRPLVAEYCLDCHNTSDQAGELDLERFVDLTTLRRDPNIWTNVAQQLEIGEMPPADAAQHR